MHRCTAHGPSTVHSARGALQSEAEASGSIPVVFDRREWGPERESKSSRPEAERRAAKPQQKEKKNL
eukprot:scaffold8633_cov154-Isochrysis_galbana.AAC.7